MRDTDQQTLAMRDTDQQTPCARAAEPFMATGCSFSLPGLGRVITVIPRGRESRNHRDRC